MREECPKCRGKLVRVGDTEKARIPNLLSAFMILAETLIAVSVLLNILSMNILVFSVVLAFSFFAWSFHWFAPLSRRVSHNNNIVGFFITLFYLIFFVMFFLLSNY
jgi:hypothetical protein